MRQPKRKHDIRQDVRDARFANERHFPGRRLGRKCVMKIPKRMIQIAKETVRGLHSAFRPAVGDAVSVPTREANGFPYSYR